VNLEPNGKKILKRERKLVFSIANVVMNLSFGVVGQMSVKNVDENTMDQVNFSLPDPSGAKKQERGGLILKRS